MEIAVPKRRYSLAEYFEMEEKSEEKHEYRDGEIFMMAGGTLEHSFAISNVNRGIGNRLEGKPCRVTEGHLRIMIPRRRIVTHPDVAVICGKPEFDLHDPSRTAVINPRLIVEVLSPGTEAYDCGDKFAAYRDIETFAEYVLVSVDRPQVEVFTRQENGGWLINTYSGLESTARLRSIEVGLPLGELYSGVEFPTGL